MAKNSLDFHLILGVLVADLHHTCCFAFSPRMCTSHQEQFGQGVPCIYITSSAIGAFPTNHYNNKQREGCVICLERVLSDCFPWWHGDTIINKERDVWYAWNLYFLTVFRDDTASPQIPLLHYRTMVADLCHFVLLLRNNDNRLFAAK